MEIDWSIIPGIMPQLLAGARITIFIALIGLVGGTILGLVAGLMRAYGGRCSS